MLRPGRILLVSLLAAGVCSPQAEAQESASITGVVLDEADRPIDGVIVFLDSGPRSTLTDTSGVFRLEVDRSGAHTLSYRRAGYSPRTFSLQLVPGESRDVGTLRLQAGEEPAATLRGRISDRIGGGPLEGTVVELNGLVIAVTDSTGLFESVSVPVFWGMNQLRLRYSAFGDAEATDDFWVGNPNETYEFDVTLDVAPVDVAGVSVETDQPVPAKLRGFYERMEGRAGTFLVREDIEARSLRRVSDLFTSYWSSRRSRAADTFGRAATTRCEAPLFFLDGQLVGSEVAPVFIDEFNHPNVNDFVHPDDVEAVEIYDTVSRLPILFNRSGSGCGVIAIWTR